MPLFTDLPPASFESFDGTVIRYHRAGHGSPVIMIHGSGGGLHSWQPVAEQLPDRFDLWLPARRGYAPSGPGHSPKHFADEVRDLAAIIGMIGRPAHLVGMSYGATVALHAAASGLAVRSLTLWEPPLYAAGAELAPVLSRFEQLTANGDHNEAQRLLAEKVARVPAELLEQPAATAAEDTPDDSYGWSRDLESMAGDTSYLDRWSSVTTPTLLMRGSDTWQPMPETVERLAAVLPNARLETLPGQMHFAPSTAPAEVAGILADFLY
ncbi:MULTISPECIES: alpha/beta fold hydrolase [Nocardia]|uniref:alpha/beta fold hydrolase n=1 Tax=Nocardia TaxID=1817 RepID=UPI001895E598|nr:MULTISPECIES: alpha/beta hydrolase [Nocardia]MBF6352474.1 alpha/beta hydrolase [Nocardia flavorosea]